MNVLEAVETFRRGRKKTQEENDLYNRTDWCSYQSHYLIDNYQLLTEFGISEDNYADMFLLQGFLLGRILDMQVVALEEIGKRAEASRVRTKARGIRGELEERKNKDYPTPEGLIHASNIMRAVNYFFFLATAESQGEFGLRTSMPPGKVELWRHAWQGKI